MKFYLAGPMSGIPEMNIPLFMSRSQELRDMGYEISNPADCPDVEDQASVKWEDWMRRDIKMLLECDGIMCLPGWENSKGASLEVHIARKLNMPVLCANLLSPILELATV